MVEVAFRHFGNAINVNSILLVHVAIWKESPLINAPKAELYM